MLLRHLLRHLVRLEALGRAHPRPWHSEAAAANRRRKSKTLVPLSSSCRAKDVSVFSGAHRVWQVISQIPTAVPALLIIIAPAEVLLLRRLVALAASGRAPPRP